MSIITKYKKGEFFVLAVILIIFILNCLAYIGLGLNQQSPTKEIMNVLMASGIVYASFFVLSATAIVIGHARIVKFLFYGLLSFMTAHIIINLFYLITDTRISENGQAILSDAFLIWSVSVLVFSLWYWIIDREGPVARELGDDQTRYDLLFPQYQSKIPGWDNWKPKFLDYVFFSFFTSSSFAPADTLPLTKRTKFLMMIETCISLIIIGMVVSRAISLVQ